MKSKTKIKNIVKNLFAILITIIAFFGLIDLFRPNSFTLTINTDPNDATIIVNNSITETGRIETELRRGTYVIRVEKNGYIPDNRTISLTSDTELSITLSSLFANAIESEDITKLDTPTFSATKTGINGEVIGINNTNGNLIRFSGGNIQTIYSGVVRDYDISGNNLVVLDDVNYDRIIVINLVNNSRNTINLTELSPIIAVAISENNIYFLAEFDIERKTPSVYGVPITGGSPTKLSETRALHIGFLEPNYLLLHEDAHDVGINVLHFFETENEVELFTKNADSYAISPNRLKMYLQTSNQMEIMDTETFESKFVFTGGSSRAIWKDDQTIILFKNDDNGINYATLNTNEMSLSQFRVLIRDISIQKVYGISGDKLIMQDYDNNVLSLDLP